MKKIFLTGGCGYIGDPVIRELLKANMTIICYDLLIYGDKTIGNFLKNKNFHLIRGDVRDKKKTEDAMQGCDAVIHLAGIVGDKPCEVLGNLSYDINYNGTVQLADIAKKKGVKKFIFASTCSNYGISNPNSYATEESKLNPVSLYAESKIDCEKYLTKITNENFKALSLRIATIYGVAERIRFDLTVNSFAYEACRDKEISVFASDSWRPYAHVKDIARIIKLSLVKNFKSKRTIFNAGFTKQNFTKRNIVNKLLKLLPNLKVNFIDISNDLRNYKVDFTKIEKELKIKNDYDVEKGFKEIIKLYKKGLINNNYFNKTNLDGVIKFYKKQKTIL